ncbi:MAG: Gfo/Idh/MocA family oxidoreductase [Fibrobacter sp.]|nr:Gfo/Idh/MocA family oxidoreductase [Fibrobacter sp.]
MKFAILGCGFIATKMAEAVKAIESRGVEAYAVASRSLTKAEKFAKDYGFGRAYGSYEELAKDPAVDLVYIATPHSEHYNNILLCLEHGKNLLVEKAFTANALMASEVIALAEEKGVFLSEAMWTRFLPAVQMVKDLILARKIGKVESVEADFSMPLSHIERLRKPELAGGALLDLGIYSLTFADIFLTDDEIAGAENHIVQTKTHCVKFDTGVDATDWIDLIYANGQVAHLKTSMVAPLKNEGVIYGTDGFIRVLNLNDMVEIQLFDKAGSLLESITPPRIENCYEYEVLACKAALEKGQKECAEMPHSKTMQMMTQMDGLRASWGVSYPFELSPAQVWGRSGDRSILEIFDIETGKSEVLDEFDCVIEAPNWSADGKFLTFNREGRIYKYEIASGDVTEVPSYFVDNCNNDHVLAPDGTGLYVSHHTKEDGLSRIYKIFYDGRMPELVTPLAPSYLHGITPDGKMLAYCAERNGEYDIYTIPTAGGNETQLTTAFGLNDGPEYDCDGEYIWFNSVRTGRMQAWRMKADGSEQTQMTFDAHLNTWFPHISPDRTKVVMLAYHERDVRPGEHVPNKNVEIRLMTGSDKTGWSEPRTILKLFGGQGTINVNSWAPDSKRFAYVRYEKK